jgi:hypothetical protein
MNLIANEQIKLTASWLNAIAAGIIVTGAIAPIVAAIYGLPGPAQAAKWIMALVSVIWF